MFEEIRYSELSFRVRQCDTDFQQLEGSLRGVR
jgi:hypothetical protein